MWKVSLHVLQIAARSAFAGILLNYVKKPASCESNLDNIVFIDSHYFHL